MGECKRCRGLGMIGFHMPFDEPTTCPVCEGTGLDKEGRRLRKLQQREVKIEKDCESKFSKFLGLMFSPIKTTLFIFKNDVRHSVHSFFVFSTIDLAFLDERMNVIETKTLKPFRIYFPKKSYRYLIEGKNLNLRIGNTATFK